MHSSVSVQSVAADVRGQVAEPGTWDLMTPPLSVMHLSMNQRMGRAARGSRRPSVELS
jgi:hypothetical protein